MATKLFLRNTTANGITDTGDGVVYDMVTTAGAAVDTDTVTLTAGGTNIQWTQTGGGSSVAWISGRVPSGGFTLTSADFSAWFRESNLNDNAGGRLRVYKYTPGTPTITELGGPFDDGVEWTTSIAEYTWTANVTDTAFAENDRILIRVFATNVGSMTAGTADIQFNAADAATGDSFFNIAENVTFKANTFEAALSGSAGTGSPGSVAASIASALSGFSATGAVGSLGFTVDGVRIAADGNTRIAADGNRRVTAGYVSHEETAGNTATGAVGSLTASVSTAVSGVAGSGSAGSIAATVSTALAGNAATGGVGTLTTAVSYSIAISGNEATGSPGSLAATAAVAASGNSATGAVGSTAARVAVTLTGEQATGAVGSVAAQGSVLVALSGVSATGAVGNVGASSVTEDESGAIVRGDLRWASGLRRRAPDDEAANDETEDEAAIFLLMAA